MISCNISQVAFPWHLDLPFSLSCRPMRLMLFFSKTNHHWIGSVSNSNATKISLAEHRFTFVCINSSALRLMEAIYILCTRETHLSACFCLVTWKSATKLPEPVKTRVARHPWSIRLFTTIGNVAGITYKVDNKIQDMYTRCDKLE